MDTAQTGELVQVSINCEGKDILITAPLETALRLLNDPDEARLFVEGLSNADTMDDAEQQSDQSEKDHEDIQQGRTSDLVEDKEVKDVLWTNKGKQSEEDHEATLLLLKLRSDYNNKFNDKKHSNTSLWQKISHQMTEAGYNLGKKNAAEKCRQKFTNLQNKVYFPYIRHMRKTGEKKKKPPLYFDEVHNILGDKDKSTPRYLQDSLDSVGEPSTSTVNTSEDSDGSDIRNRFSQSVKTLRPKTANTQLVETITHQCEQDREERREQFNVLSNLLRDQSTQRERMLQLLDTFVTQRAQHK